ncbi:MAG TPA: hypothetical protein VNF29_13445 [Candidatus Binataceae bacterium]|nr:hypothetical protein [Candidatus Binataceae bacterium]
MSAAAAGAAERAEWLQVLEADSPILLIAPHGGRAGPAARATLHPKVNDLHTAEIARELAHRLGAAALINFGMDRNRLDCNRLTQLAEQAPWLLEMLAERMARIVARHGRAIVLMIHGWNIIEPRVDIGLGVRTIGAELRPTGSARVSASDEFIHGPLTDFAARLRESGVTPSFGMRYPAGALHNLVQAFTERHRDSPLPALRAIAALSVNSQVDAAQLELSVAVRMPGRLRDRCLEALAAAFDPGGIRAASTRARLTVVREPRPRAAAPARATAPTLPARVGIELFDLRAGIGAMASFDLRGGFGARIMILSHARRVALCTCEGRVKFAGDGLSLGPLTLAVEGRELRLAFSGPAVIVPDAAAYLSIERALASGRLDPAAKVSLAMRLPERSFDPAAIFGGGDTSRAGEWVASFAKMNGAIEIEGESTPVHAVARAGLSFTGLGPQQFRERRMLWACFEDGRDPSALELRIVTGESGEAHRSANFVAAGVSNKAELAALEIDTPAPDAPPSRITASARWRGEEIALAGSVAAFVPLSRPGSGHGRIFTTLGFAKFRVAGREAAGMFEYSRVVDAPAAAPADDDDETPAE